MSNEKIYFVIAGLIIVIIVGVIFFLNKRKKSKENFGMLPSFQWKVNPELADSRQAVERGQFYSIPGTYQSLIAPRMAGMVDYGSYINYRLPDSKNLAIPNDPLEYGNVCNKPVKENFRENFNTDPSACGNGNNNMPMNMSQQLSDSQQNNSNNPYPEISDMLPVGDMTTIDASGNVSQPVIYDRYMYANRNSRLRGQGDMIRGDLAIAPCYGSFAGGPWFNVSVQPNVDLQQGAMNVLAGENNENTRSLAQLINTYSGGAETTIAGVNMSNQFNTDLSAAQRDITVTAYP